ncbi:MAG: hypothetical protein KAH32_05750 [Chlamydiia bacterium]|nr:hypothetical protein [Chlamydiia bacterium]
MEKPKKNICCWIKDPILLAGIVLFMGISVATMTMIQIRSGSIVDSGDEVQMGLYLLQTNVSELKDTMELHNVHMEQSMLSPEDAINFHVNREHARLHYKLDNTNTTTIILEETVKKD